MFIEILFDMFDLIFIGFPFLIFFLGKGELGPKSLFIGELVPTIIYEWSL